MRCCHENSLAAGPVLVETEIPSYFLNQGPSAQGNPVIRVETILEPYLFQIGPSVSLKKVENKDIWFLVETLEAREFPWQQNYESHFVSFVV